MAGKYGLMLLFTLLYGLVGWGGLALFGLDRELPGASHRIERP